MEQKLRLMRVGHQRAMQEPNRLLEAPLMEADHAHKVKRIGASLRRAGYQGDEQSFGGGGIALLQEPRRQLDRLLNCRQRRGCDYGITLADISRVACGPAMRVEKYHGRRQA
jgi:hypothetical protein